MKTANGHISSPVEVPKNLIFHFLYICLHILKFHPESRSLNFRHTIEIFARI